MIPAKSDVAILQFKLSLFQSLHILGLTLPLVAIGDHCFGVIVVFGVMKTRGMLTSWMACREATVGSKFEPECITIRKFCFQVCLQRQS